MQNISCVPAWLGSGLGLGFRARVRARARVRIRVSVRVEVGVGLRLRVRAASSASTDCRSSTALSAPLVPTGTNAGVWMTPCGVVILPTRAREPGFFERCTTSKPKNGRAWLEIGLG